MKWLLALQRAAGNHSHTVAEHLQNTKHRHLGRRWSSPDTVIVTRTRSSFPTSATSPPATSCVAATHFESSFASIPISTKASTKAISATYVALSSSCQRCLEKTHPEAQCWFIPSLYGNNMSRNAKTSSRACQPVWEKFGFQPDSVPNRVQKQVPARKLNVLNTVPEPTPLSRQQLES